MTARLVVSLSGITADSLPEAKGFAGELAERRVPLSLLVPPRRRAGSPAVLDWVAQRCAAGDALVLHGLGDGSAGRLRWRGAECAVLPAHEAGLKLLAARATLEHLGLATECFAPPGWLASRGLLAALRRHGFRLSAELHGVRDLDTDELTTGRVFGFACHPRVEPWWCLAGVLQAARLARRGGLLRLSVPAGDLARSGVRQAVLDAVDIALHHDARPTTYLELAGHPVDHSRSRPRDQTAVSSPRGSTVTVEPAGARFANNP